MTMRTAAVLMLLLAMLAGAYPAHAQKTDACKICRETLQACLKAHTKDACNNDFTICMRHCRTK
jgi:hypothetical protein